MTSAIGSWIGNCETKSSSWVKAGYSAALAQVSTPEIIRISKGAAEIYNEVPEEIKKAIEMPIKEIVKNRIGGEKEDIGAFLASVGAELILSNSEAEEGLQPSDELMRVVQWMQLYQ